MNPIDNSQLLGYNKNYDYSGLQPKLTVDYDAGAGTITVTEGGAVPAGDAIKNINVQVHDGFGGTKYGNIAAAAGNVVINIAGAPALNPSKGLAVTASLLTRAGLTATGSLHNVGMFATPADLSHWNKGESGAEAVNPGN